jgi:hypothetical protein
MGWLGGCKVLGGRRGLLFMHGLSRVAAVDNIRFVASNKSRNIEEICGMYIYFTRYETKSRARCSMRKE